MTKSGARLATLQLTTSHSQRLNNGKPLGTGCCEWLWSIATWANGTFPLLESFHPCLLNKDKWCLRAKPNAVLSEW